MGIAIMSDESAPIPRPVVISFQCDGAPACDGYFTRVTNYPSAYSQAMRAGWLERRGADGRRLFLCPKCSGKRADTTRG
jgi:hypothetical protein